MQKKQITISFAGDEQMKSLLEKWASEDERSMSYILRKLIKREAQNREQKRSENDYKVNQS